MTIACSASLKAPSNTEVAYAKQRFPEVDSLQLTHGYKLYVRKCSSCHSLYYPGQFTYTEWVEVFPEMAEDAKLDSAESKLISTYVFALAKQDF
ncbi:MAG TPA: hypothetical protein PKM16_08660 [Bacteroidia bacterium]|nr:hypothetical protein [Bacteroidia bacterium]